MYNCNQYCFLLDTLFLFFEQWDKPCYGNKRCNGNGQSIKRPFPVI